MVNKFKGRYGESENKNFKVIDSIPVPHPYCITHLHLKYNEGMYLTAESIKKTEEKGAVCDICRKNVNSGNQAKILSYEDHKQALVLSCKKEMKNNGELKEYLLKIKDRAERNGYVGFVFMKEF